MTLNLKAIVSLDAKQAKAELGGTTTALNSVKTAATGSAGGINAETTSLQEMAKAGRTATASLREVEKGATSSHGSVRMFGQQLSQVVQQGSATGQWAQAFAIQAADIGIAFGTVGTAIGIAATVAIPMIVSAFGSASQSEKEAVDQLKSLTDTLSDFNSNADLGATKVDTLREKYGLWAAQVQQTARWMAEVNAGQALAELSAETMTFSVSLDAVKAAQDAAAEAAQRYLDAQKLAAVGVATDVQSQRDVYELLKDDVDTVAASIGLTASQAIVMQQALSDVKGATNMQELADRATSALDAIHGMFPAGAVLPPELAKAAAKLQEVRDAAAAGLTTMGKMPGVLGSATGAANGLAGAMGRVSMAANAALSQMIQMDAKRLAIQSAVQSGVKFSQTTSMNFPSNGGFIPSGTGQTQQEAFDAAVKKLTTPAATGTGNGGGGGATKQATDEVQAYIEKLKLEQEITQTLDPVQKEMLQNRKLLAEATPKQTEAIEALLEAQQKEANLTDAMKAFGQATYDALSGLIIEGKSASDVMKGLEKAILQAALQALVLGEGPLAGIFGTKGTSLISLIFGGKKAAGGMIYGAGGARDDKVMIAASAGEYVVNGRAANANRPLLDYINGGGQVGGYASGGTVAGRGTTSGGGSGGTVVSMPIHIDARGAQAGVAEQIAAKFQELAPQISQIAVSAVAQARSRGYAV